MRTSYKYHVLEFEHGAVSMSTITSAMNGLAKSGWRLVETIGAPVEAGETFFMIFELDRGER